MSLETITKKQTLVLKRTFAAPVEKVYQAWIDPARMMRWLSPNVRWNAPLIDSDPVPGGRHNITMRHSDGDEIQAVGHYVEIVPQERISFTWTWLENPKCPDEMLVTIEFRAVPAGTELTLTHDRFPDPSVLAGASEGWGGCLEMLAHYLAGTPLLGTKN